MELEINYYSLNDICNWEYGYQDKTPTFTAIQELFEDTIVNFPTIKYGNDLDELLQPLVNRWLNPRCYLVASETEISADDWSYLSVKSKYLFPILNKLDNVCRVKVEEFNRLNTFLKSTITNEATSTSISRHNDTPTNSSDYSAEKYTSDISQNTSVNKSSANSLEDYDAKVNRLRNIQQEIINEMKEFEIWI